VEPFEKLSNDLLLLNADLNQKLDRCRPKILFKQRAFPLVVENLNPLSYMVSPLVREAAGSLLSNFQNFPANSWMMATLRADQN